MTDEPLEAAMWRVCWHLDKNDYPRTLKQIRSSVNVEPELLKEAMKMMVELNVIEREKAEYSLTDEDAYGGTLMKVFPQVRDNE